MFRAGLPQREADIRAALDALCPGQPIAEVATLHRLIHNLAGAGGTFGMPELTDLARPIAEGLRPWLRGDDELLDGPTLQALGMRVGGLLAALHTAGGEPGAGPD